MLINGIEFTIGADPEVFVSKEGKFVSAHGMVEGTKEQPFPVNNGAVQVDGMALEFNIDPAKDEEEFRDNVNSVLKQLSDMVPEYDLEAVPVAEFGQEVMDSTPREAKEMGCDPDFNAWEGGAVNPKPDGEVDFRTGAGHVHIGWTQDMDINDPGHIQACIALVKQLDYYLGLPSLLFDKCDKRRELYGEAGAFRVKPYGVEYRVLSNAWLKSDVRVSFIYNNTVEAIKALFRKDVKFEQCGTAARSLINKSGVSYADRYCTHLNIPTLKEA